MSETTRVVQRYYEPYTDITPALVKSKNGEFVLYTDYQRIVAERDAAVRRLASITAKFPWHRGEEGLPDVPVLQERYDTLRARLAACEKIVEAAQAYEKWMGKWHDYTKTTGDVPHKVEAALINAVRAAVAAETQGTFVKITDNISGEMVRAYNVPHAETQGEK